MRLGRRKGGARPIRNHLRFVLGNSCHDVDGYATLVHGGQVRKGTSTPYVAHLLAVAATVLEYGGDEDLAIAALLHDSVEDQGGKARLEDVRNRFGERVARIVEACSDSLADTAKGERKAHWQERKEAYIAHLRQADEDGGRGASRRPQNCGACPCRR
jgi:(p)ppGpp synthase/HD superfamily hydrolase